jgi:hypothetical protein
MADWKTLLVRLPAEDHAALRRYASLTGTSMSATVRRAIHEFLTSKRRDSEIRRSLKAMLPDGEQ